MTGTRISTADLFHQYHDRVTLFAKQQVGNDADDLVQEAFIRVYKYLTAGRTLRSPLSFLYTTVRRLAIDRYRAGHVDVIDVDVEACAENTGPSLERSVMADREFEALVVAISELPPRQQQALILRKVYGYSWQEVGDQMGVTSETARHQSMSAFKRVLAVVRT